MKLKCILTVFAVMVNGSLFAQNVTKADFDKLSGQVNTLSSQINTFSEQVNTLSGQLDALSQKVTQLEINLERVITENVNLVEQLNIRTVTSMTDNKNGITFDIVKVEPDANTNDVVISLRITNNSGTIKTIKTDNTEWVAYDSDSNKSDNSYKAWDMIDIKLEHGVPVNATVTFKNVSTTCSYLSLINGTYKINTAGLFDKFTLKFTGVHIPW